MRYLVLGGAGFIGHEVVHDLIRSSKFERLVVADLDGARADALVASAKDRRVTGARVDVADATALDRLARDCDVIVNCTPGHQNVEILKSAVRARVNYLDIVGSMMAEERLALDGEARAAGTTAVIAMGCSPGLTNVLAAYGVRLLDRADEVHIEYASFRPFNPSPGFLDTALRQYTPHVKCPVFTRGALTYVPAFSGLKTVGFPPPIGDVDLYFPPHSEVVTLSRFIPGLREVTVRGSYHPEVMRALRVFHDLGLMDETPTPIEGRTATPRALLQAILARKPLHFGGITAYCLHVSVTGLRDGCPTTHRFTISHPADTAWSDLPQRTMTALCTSVGAQLLASAADLPRGVLAPEACLDPVPFIEGVAARGIIVDRRTEQRQSWGR
ncbi:MAG: saccharopine dehydrogenase NADP-binding domain-containing protein [Candidatus Rokubacteria bacterium]|nr:saccharopine dehydrogenase NADP-binding domain-containing protein [Candidatus Rokubacteria bacterium]